MECYRKRIKRTVSFYELGVRCVFVPGNGSAKAVALRLSWKRHRVVGMSKTEMRKRRLGRSRLPQFAFSTVEPLVGERARGYELGLSHQTQFGFRFSNSYWTYCLAMSSVDNAFTSSGYPQQLRVNFVKMQVGSMVMIRCPPRNVEYGAKSWQVVSGRY